MKNTLSKNERLSSLSRIEELFSNGQSFFIYPLRIIYTQTQSETSGVRVLFSVPKKKFKKAVDRNRIKRLFRESYRVQKHALLEKSYNCSFCLNVAFIYTGNLADISLKDIHTAMEHALSRLINLTGD